MEEGKREKKKKIEGVRRGCKGYRVVSFPVLSTILRTGNKTGYKATQLESTCTYMIMSDHHTQPIHFTKSISYMYMNKYLFLLAIAPHSSLLASIVAFCSATASWPGGGTSERGNINIRE